MDLSSLIEAFKELEAQVSEGAAGPGPGSPSILRAVYRLDVEIGAAAARVPAERAKMRDLQSKVNAFTKAAKLGDRRAALRALSEARDSLMRLSAG